MQERSHICQVNRMLCKVRELRIAYDYSQEYVASELGINQNTYSKVETGQSKMTVDRLAHIARIYKKELMYFFEYEESQTDVSVIGGEASGDGSSSSRREVEQLNHNQGVGSRSITAGNYYERYERHEHHHYSYTGFQITIDVMDIQRLLIYPADFIKLLEDVSGVVTRINSADVSKTVGTLLNGLKALNQLMPRINAAAVTLMEQHTLRLLEQPLLTAIYNEKAN